METKNEGASVYLQKDKTAIRKSEYETSLKSAKQEYETAKKDYLDIVLDWKEIAHVGQRDVESSLLSVIEYTKRNFGARGITYASAILSAMNSPSNVFKVRSLLLELRVVVSELEKLENRYYSPSQKEVIIASLINLMNGLQGNDSNKEYYDSSIVKYVHQVDIDKKTPHSIRMLVYAQASTVSFFPAEIRKGYADEVLDLLTEIYDCPTKIQYLNNDWKTYVRLSRIMFMWKCMFRGLHHDNSKELYVESYFYFLKYFYK